MPDSEERLKSKCLNNDIIKELKKRHIGNDKQLFLTLLTLVASRFNPKDRISAKVRGNTSVGKTNMVDTCLLHIPGYWYCRATRITRASLEDDVEPFNAIIINEVQKDERVNEALKQIAEDGMETWKKDPNTAQQTHKGNIPRKTVIDTSTTNESDEEVANRAIIINVEEDTKRYQKVIDNYQESLIKIEKEQSNNESWLFKILHHLDLKCKFDAIIIPYAPAIPIEAHSARIQRDIKRFWSIVKALAWINCYNRRQEVVGDKKILFANIDDLMWALSITKEAFVHSISGISPEIQDILDCIEKNVNAGNVTFCGQSNEPYVDRKIVQQDLGIKSQKTIKKHCEDGENLGLINIYQERMHMPVYIQKVKSTKVSKSILIGYNSVSIRETLEPYEDKLITNLLLTDYYPNTNLILTNNTTTTTVDNTKVSNNNKTISTNDDYWELIGRLREKLLTYNTNLSKSKEVV